MQTDLFVYLFVGATAIFYLLVLMAGRTGSVRDFYTLNTGVTPLGRGMASAADWLCAATFLGLFGLFSVDPQYAQWILLGWLSGLVWFGVWLAPAVFRSGQTCLAGFVAQGYASRWLGYQVQLILVLVSVLLLALQLKGLGIMFSRHLQLSVHAGIVVALLLILFYVLLAAMKAMTQVHMLQYCICFCAFLVPAIYLAAELGLPTHWIFFDPTPDLQLRLDLLQQQLGLSGTHALSVVEQGLMLAALVAGTALLPHLLIRFQSVKQEQDVRSSAAWMLVFIAVIYASMPWVSSMGQLRLIEVVNGPLNEGVAYTRMPSWFYAWEQTAQLAWYDHTYDGRVQYAAGAVFEGAQPRFADQAGVLGERVLTNPANPVYLTQQRFPGELYVADDIRLYLLPELIHLPGWVVGLLNVGITAALLSTAAVILISTVQSSVLQLGAVLPLSSRLESVLVRLVALSVLLLAALVAVLLPGGILEWMNRAIALTAASLFPAVLLLLWRPGISAWAAGAGMLGGLLLSLGYTLAYDTGWLVTFWPESWPVYPPVSMAGVVMLVNLICVVLLARVLPDAHRESARHTAVSTE
ncbi:Acetate permease ActP (cation/acetate symporter) [Nitrincola lacisaponensis]|uniref:Acetate permease ActP (Cation/acetate symporter) n=1 Tax=Nitrincola lacisaponensis TaxID=267850 RepID=A0A063Y1Q8_9GAMM|nr:hypothetical protein [Nitrincola lacisaponensis]KDE39609.1 Acetate permease ActP (cation/acetate symporter) [Nitrincola lacisaponensis]